MNFFPGVLLASLAVSATAATAAITAGQLIKRRVAIRREVEFRAMFATDPPTDPAREVEVLLSDGERRMAWHRPPLGWIDADTLTPLDQADVFGWRKPPFASDIDVDPADWSIEKIREELTREFPPTRDVD